MNPWYSMLMTYIAEEIKNAQEDRDLFVQLCTTPIPDLARKTVLLTSLNDLRTNSSKRLYWLRELAPKSEHLTPLKAKVLGAGDDSFLTNHDLAMSKDRADKLIEAYQNQASVYVRAIRDFAMARDKWLDT